MKIDLAPEIPAAGFNFENCRRNATMINKGYVPPKVRKTGTTIVGIIFNGGVILGADTRATEGPIVADKNCDKIHYLAKNMYCCGAGTAADTLFTTNIIASNLELLRLNTGRVVPVATANTLTKRMLFNYQGHISAALIVGGVDATGPHLYQIHPHGSSDSLLYTTMGSGSLAAMAVFEARYREDINEEDGKKLVRDAIAAGIFNDLGSGSNVDLCILRNNYVVDYLRGYEYANEKGKRTLDYTFKTGTTATLKSTVRNIEITENVKMIPVGGATPMDTD